MKHFLSLLLIFLCLGTTVQAQFKISGKVTSEESLHLITDVEIYLSNPAHLDISNGNYVISDLSPGAYELVFFSMEHEVLRKIIRIKNNNIVFDVLLKPLVENLSAVVLHKRKKVLSSLVNLKDVVGVSIFAGKKTELIQLDNTIGNLATNNPRQIYAKVAGLNIWESDGAGLQLGIGGRGLDPNRSANFNVRQNGYDISADALGYPESYYTPPTEALERIEVVRGAASLQFGTQFGGLLNFITKKPHKTKPFAFESRQTYGSFNLMNTFNRISGTLGKFSYSTYFQYKQGDGARPNAEFDQTNVFANINYQFTDTKIGLEFTHMNYLAQQAGGLTDAMFLENHLQSNRKRNWFEVNWNLFAVNIDHKFSKNTKANIRVFALDASRKAVGYRSYRPSSPDNPNNNRELIVGQFKTLGAEARILHTYNFLGEKSTLLLGTRYYQGNNTGQQGIGTSGSDANFNFVNIDGYIKKGLQPDETIASSFYKYPNRNIAIFGENIIRLSDKFLITPGFRLEKINTKAQGTYRNITSNGAGDVRNDILVGEDKAYPRNFALFGLGMSYKPSSALELYANLSQNYRSITFSDIRVVSPSALIDPNIDDEKGYSLDLGIRGDLNGALKYDATLFTLLYDNRIGDALAVDSNSGVVKKVRTNVGKALIYGVESLLQWDVLETFQWNLPEHQIDIFANTALIKSEYISQFYANAVKQIKGKEVEFVPALNFKTGIQFAYKNFGSSLQYAYLSKQYSDATNTEADLSSGVEGEIPAYSIMDLSFSYKYNKWKLETGVNNLLDNAYFTRRATGYPGPGIIPSDPRSFYLTVAFKM
ncbi:MAG: TonB-dependent receptor [Flavobacteriaceae bacterium]|nr:MAG: TonB-dependent receptor [Flavobacteriaceae bacterium]